MTRIYYFCSPAESGEIQTNYRHVDLLNKNGFDAAILHRLRSDRCTWFENETPVVGGEVEVAPDDVIVMGEAWGPMIGRLMAGTKKVVFNQNAYHTFLGYDDLPTSKTVPYLQRDFLGTLCVSEDNRAYLGYLFGERPLHRIRLSVDMAKFSFDSTVKKKQICWLPSKGKAQAAQVMAMASIRGAFEGWELVSIEDMSRDEVAATLGESAIYLSFGIYEGFPLLLADAVASGCLVVGYHGQGGEEFMLPRHSYPVESGSIVPFARAIEEATALFTDDFEAYCTKAKAGADWIFDHYPLEQEEADLVAAWESLLGQN